MRTAQTGRGTAQTQLKPAAIAAARSMKLDSGQERTLFQDMFARYREVVSGLWAASAGPLEIETLAGIARDHGSVHEAAFIEAVTSLRAEGVRL